LLDEIGASREERKAVRVAAQRTLRYRKLGVAYSGPFADAALSAVAPFDQDPDRYHLLALAVKKLCREKGEFFRDRPLRIR
jgi:hypothetical protein